MYVILFEDVCRLSNASFTYLSRRFSPSSEECVHTYLLKSLVVKYIRVVCSAKVIAHRYQHSIDTRRCRIPSYIQNYVFCLYTTTNRLLTNHTRTTIIQRQLIYQISPNIIDSHHVVSICYQTQRQARPPYPSGVSRSQ